MNSYFFYIDYSKPVKEEGNVKKCAIVFSIVQ